MRHVKLFAVLVAAGFATGAHATNGYFSHGYGMKAKGMAGAAAASTADTFGGANNPASMVWVGNRLDVGADLFSPNRETRRSGATGVPGAQESEDDYFLIPEFGYNRMLSPNLSVGLTVYGNGGMNTDYPTGTYDCSAVVPPPAGPLPPGSFMGNPLCGPGDLGVDLSQLIIAPTLSYKVNDRHSVGVAPLLGFQRFSAYGLEGFSVISSDPSKLTGRSHDYSRGLGLRVGWLGKLSDTVTVGAAYTSEMKMSEFDKYAGLFAEQGDFDIPANWTIGTQIQASPTVKVALDYQRIQYGDARSINNSSQSTAGLLGNDGGPGFGWRDIDVWKLGVEYAYSNNLTVRAGWNHGDNPIKAADATFNILAPGVVEDHLTLGFTYTLPSGGEITMAYMHAFSNSVSGTTNPTYFPVGGTDQIKMHQDSIGIAYGMKM